MALVKAALENDLESFHALGPTKAEPTAEATWLDRMHYDTGQQLHNPDHELVLSLVGLVVEYGCGSNTARCTVLLEWLNSWLAEPRAVA